MGLGRLLHRSTRYTAENTVTGETQVFTIVDNLRPDWAADDYQGGMSIPGAWRASVLLSDLLGMVPWDAYRIGPNRPVELIAPTPWLLEQPNPPETRMNTFSGWGLDLIYHGNAIGLIAARSSSGWPTAAVAVPATMMGVRRITERGMSTLPIGAIEYSLGGQTFGAQDVIHIKGPAAPGGLRGMGVLEAHFASFDLAHEQIRQARSLSRHGVPTGVLQSENPDLNEAEAKGLKAKWMESQRDRTIAVLNATTKFQPLSWNPEQLQLVEARRYTLTDLELIFGLPVGWLGGMHSSKQYSNIEADAVNLLKFSLGGHLARFEQALSLQFPRGTVVEADLGHVLRADTLTRYQAYAIGLDKGFLTLDEIRKVEKRAPLPPKPKTEQVALPPAGGATEPDPEDPDARTRP
ncbi:phage portal protein [Micromonospora sp. NPDC050417]|uniref:phage portal protein n=1 Tax=Micromonospora sp. NPDC050417 TaxID=3364280 RepID=UPI0037900713